MPVFAQEAGGGEAAPKAEKKETNEGKKEETPQEVTSSLC
jgi:hypothetical protein